MLSAELKNILKLTKKTGDRVVVYDSQEPANSFVLMDLDSYEKLVNFSSENTEEIAEKTGNTIDLKEVEEKAKIGDKKELTEEDLTDKINREISLWKNQENPSFVAGDEKIEKSSKPWSIPPKVKQKAKEVE